MELEKFIVSFRTDSDATKERQNPFEMTSENYLPSTTLSMERLFSAINFLEDLS